jgi:2-polyprenyl-6-methoxyphenol hydroxylase-like FAD-dependent oxidoreductase
MTKRPRKALIIGAGIAGPVTGIFLKKAGIDAQVSAAVCRSRPTACMYWPRSALPTR